MSDTSVNNSKTECVIAIEDSNDDSDGDAINEEVSATLNSLLESIETLPQIPKFDSIESEVVQIDDNDSDEEVIEETNGEQCLVTNEESTNEMIIHPIDDIQDIENMEVDIRSRDDDSDEFDAYDEDFMIEDAEDCQVIDDIPKRDTELRSKQQNNESDDDIEIIEDSHDSVDNRSEQNTEVIDLSDDEEECVIINDSFSIKLNKMIENKAKAEPKTSNSPIYSSESFIPLSQPSTSTANRSPETHQKRSYRPFQSADRRPYSQTNSSYSSNSSSSLLNLFGTPKDLNYSRNRDRPLISSSYIEPINNNNSKEDDYLYNDSIPFLYEESKPSTSSEIIGSSNVADIDLITESVKLDRHIVQNVVNLIEDQCTVPFIVRYRQSAISGIDAERVRKISTVYNELKTAKERAKDVEQILKKQDRINPRLKAALNRCKTVFEVEHLFRLCRNESQDSEKYRNLGLGDSAVAVLEGKRLDPNHFTNQFAFALDTSDKINEGWSAIIADIISKDCDVLEYLISVTRQYIPTLHIVFNEEKAEEMRSELNPKTLDVIHKYLRFKSFIKPVNRINAHSYMAIERGEAIGLLNVFIEFETIVLNKLIDFCVQKWNRCISHLLVSCVRIAFNNQLKPSLEDYIRWELRHTSHMIALDVFRKNVKYLLLEPPLRGEFVIGVDPGHDSGYKVIVVSPWLVPLDGCVLKLDHKNYESSAIKLRQLMIENHCSIIALGNGTGCRRFENMLQKKIKLGFFGKINVKYKIINESGVSYYSVTNAAKKDLPNFPPHLIGAISIARRLIDPLSELVKVDPKRLQVGMYMRDIDQEAVKKAFHEVAVECVSFCGVDVNVASFELLSKVAGLEPTIARMIIEKRDRDGLFNSRSQLKNIDGIGWKQFEQCAGFIKVMPLTRRESSFPSLRIDNNSEFPNKRCASSTDDYDPLDSTIIHPESYSSANTYLELIGAFKDQIGKQSIQNKVTSGYAKYSLPEMAQLCNTHPSNMKLIIEGLSISIDFDYRTNFAQIYIPEIQNFDELNVGMQLKGRVVNVTPMGAFIDCGIVGGTNAYTKAKECDRHSIVVNDNVLVTIEAIKTFQRRFSVIIDEVFKTNIKYI